MTRSNAREIAMHLIFEMEYHDELPEELIQAVFSQDYYPELAGESELYREELKDWHREEITTRAQTATLRQEVLWMNFEPLGQISLFKAQEAEA